MKFKEFLELYDDWNGRTRVNDNNLDMIAEYNTCKIAEERKDLHNMEVVAFGFYDGVLTVRLKESEGKDNE